MNPRIKVRIIARVVSSLIGLRRNSISIYLASAVSYTFTNRLSLDILQIYIKGSYLNNACHLLPLSKSLLNMDIELALR